MSAQIRFRMLEGVDTVRFGATKILRTARPARFGYLRTRRGRRERPRRDAPRLVSRVSPAPSFNILISPSSPSSPSLRRPWTFLTMVAAVRSAWSPSGPHPPRVSSWRRRIRGGGLIHNGKVLKAGKTLRSRGSGRTGSSPAT